MKNLPIHLVKFRKDKDEFLTEGMGNKTTPKWMTEYIIRRNARHVLSEMKLLEAYFSQREAERKTLPVLAVVKIQKEATAKSHRKDVRAMFDLKEKRNIVGMVCQDKILVKIDNKSDLDAMKTKFSSYTSDSAKFETRKAIAAITDITPFTPDIDDNLVGQTVKVKLVDYLNADLNRIRDTEFESFCQKEGLQFKEIHYSDRMKMYQIDHLSAKEISAVAKMDSVISVRQMPYILLTKSPEETDTTVDIKSPTSGVEYPTVGLLDSGIAAIPHLKSWISEDNVANLEEIDITREHGTFVAGILLYGDDLARESYTNSIPMKIQSCIINSRKLRISEAELIILIKDSINKYPQIKVWNLSQGSSLEVDDCRFSDFAIALDELQDKHRIIICKSAGNQDNPSCGKLRITQGADSVRSLVVGSIASKKLESYDADINCRSPFSRIGFGPENLFKPDLVHYGGNMSANSGVNSFSKYGNEANLSGTSFSTPRVASLAASISYQLENSYNPLLVKALLVNSASYPAETRIIGKERYKELGYGLPQDVNSILYNDENEFTMVFNVIMNKGTDLWSVDFPYPTCMVDENGFYYGDITVTMVSHPFLNPNEASEYCQSNINVLLETFDDTKRFVLGARGTPKMYRNEVRLINPQNVLAKDKYSKRLARDLNIPFTKERTLVEEYSKYQPIKKYHVNLEEMTSAKRNNCLRSTRRWAIKLQSQYRDSAEMDWVSDGTPLATEITLIIKIKDPKKKDQVYNEGVTMLNTYNFENQTLTLRQNVSIE